MQVESFPNLALFGAEHYGFVLDDNPHDRAKLPLKLLPSSLQGQVTVDACWLHPNGYPSWDLMKSLRLWAASQLGCRYRAFCAHMPPMLKLALVIIYIYMGSWPIRDSHARHEPGLTVVKKGQCVLEGVGGILPLKASPSILQLSPPHSRLSAPYVQVCPGNPSP